MDTRRPYGADAGDSSSDDLIVELARLVGQEARSSAGHGSRPERQEPRLEPQVSATPAPDAPPAVTEATAPVMPEVRTPQHSYVPIAAAPQPARTEPRLEREPTVETGDDGSDLTFDFGFGEPVTGEAETESAPVYAGEHDPGDDDPIAALIADAEEDAQREEMSRWREDEPSEPELPVEDETPEFEEPEFEDDPDYSDEPEEPEPVVAPALARGYQAPVAEPRFVPNVAATAPVDTAREIRDRDPLSEIEALIGEAARVSAEPGPMGSRKVRSVYSEPPKPQVAERREPIADPEPAALSAAERAIYAADASSTARADDRYAPAEQRRGGDDYDTEENDDPIYDDEQFVTRAPRRRRGGILVPAVAGGVLLVAIVGGYLAFAGQGAMVSGEPPVLVADGQPARTDPEPATTAAAGSDSIVFSEIQGDSAAAEDSTLVSRDETGGAAGAEVSSLLLPSATDDESGLANRRVRTVTVRPDGTIVTSDDIAQAGTSILPVDRPNVPELPGASSPDDPIGAAIAEAMGAGSATAFGPGTELTSATVAAVDPIDSAAATSVDAETPTDAALEAVVEAETGVDVPLPMPRPEGLPVITAAVPSPATETPATTTATGPVGAWVQLSSQRSEEAARAGIPDLERRYGVLFNGTPLDVSSVNLGAEGVYYRVRLPQPSMAAATNVCQTITAAGGDCFVLPN